MLRDNHKEVQRELLAWKIRDLNSSLRLLQSPQHKTGHIARTPAFPCKILFAVTFLDLHAVLSPTLSSLTKGCLYFKKYKIFTYSSDCLVHIQTTSSTTFLDPHTAEAQSQLKFPRGQRLVSLLLQHIYPQQP